MQQSKKRKKSRFFSDFEKKRTNVKVMTCKNLETTQSIFVLY